MRLKIELRIYKKKWVGHNEYRLQLFLKQVLYIIYIRII
jgi:hypothetical protein